MAELKVGVSADVSGLQKGLNTGEKEIQNFVLETDKALVKSESNIKAFSKTAVSENKKTGTSFQGLSRTLQDAAFGPGAIANNLAELGRDFTELSRSAKESGQSIGKTLVQSLAGAGGVNLALGGLTLALSLASFGLSAWTRLFGESNKEVKKGADSINEYIDSLDSVNKATAQGGVNAQNELSHLQALFNVYQDANLPLKKRKEAYKALQDDYPAYFANIKFETEASEKLKDNYNKLTKSIIATAQARAAEELVAGIDKEILVNRLKLSNLQEKEPDLIKAAVKEKKELNQLNQLGNTIGTSQFGITQGNTQQTLKAADAQQALAESFGASNALENRNNILNAEKSKLLGFINQQIADGADLTDKANKKTEETIQKTKSLNNALKGIGVGVGGNNAGPNVFSVLFNQVTAGLETLENLPTPELKFLDPNKLLAQANANLDLFKQGLAEKFQTDIGPFLEGAFSSAFGGLGDAIGNALAEGTSVLDAFGSSVLASIGDILSQFGKLTIAAGVAALGLSAALSNPTNPASGLAAIAAGTALVAIGAAVKGFSKNIAAGGKGGGAGAGITGPQSVSSGFNPATPVAGTGNAGPIAFIPNTVIKGTDIVISYNRQSSLNSRSGL